MASQHQFHVTDAQLADAARLAEILSISMAGYVLSDALFPAGNKYALGAAARQPLVESHFRLPAYHVYKAVEDQSGEIMGYISIQLLDEHWASAERDASGLLLKGVNERFAGDLFGTLAEKHKTHMAGKKHVGTSSVLSRYPLRRQALSRC